MDKLINKFTKQIAQLVKSEIAKAIKAQPKAKTEKPKAKPTSTKQAKPAKKTAKPKTKS